MSGVELIAELTDICIRQAEIIKAQQYVIEQFGDQVRGASPRGAEPPARTCWRLGGIKRGAQARPSNFTQRISGKGI